jgi:hypothetical protein
VTAGQWEALGELYASHGDPTAPENAVLIHVAQEELELDILRQQGRLP